MPTRVDRPVPVASKVSRFSYAIRNIVTEAKAVEATGKSVRYLNIGDPCAFGFRTPDHLVEAAIGAMRNNLNGYLPSAGILPAREAVAADYAQRGVHVSPDRVLITAGTSEGIELALNALVDAGDEVLVPSPTYPLYTAILAKIGATPLYYRTDPNHDWLPDIDHLRSLVTAKTRVMVVIDPNNPTGAVYPTPVRRALLDIADRYELTILADEVYGDLNFDGPVPLLGTLDLDAPIISFSSLSKAYLAPGWRTGWLVAGATPRLDGALAAMKKLADGRLCSPGPLQYAVAPALNGDRSHQVAFRAALAERGHITATMLNAIPGMRCVTPRATFYALPMVTLPPGRTDEQYVLALLRETGILCVHGSGFGLSPDLGSFRIVFLASPDDLKQIYADIGAFTAEYPSAPREAAVTTERTDDPRALIRYALLGIALTTALFWMLFQIRETLLLIYVAALVAIGLSPLVLAIQNHPRTPRRMPRWSAILVIYVLFVALVVALAMLIFPPLIAQARELWAEIPQLVDRGQQWLMQRGIINQPISVRQAVEQAPGAGAKDAVGTVLSTIVSVVGGIFGIVAILILAFYLMLDADKFLRVFVRFFPRGRRMRVRHACEQVTLKVSAWLGGQLLLAGIIGSTAALGLWLIGVPYFYVLALVAAIGELIPMVGPVLSAIPAIIVGFTVSPQMGAGVAIFFFVQQQIENHLLVPKVMERQVGVSAVVVIISLLLGGSLLGIVGAILAVPTAAILQVLVQELFPEVSTD